MVTRHPLARHVLPALIAALFLLPLWFMLSGSLRPLGVPPPRGVELLPPDPTLAAYRQLPALIPLATHVKNSAIVVAAAVPLTVLVASWAGFGVRLLRRRLRRLVIGASLALMLVPVTMVWATRFEVYRSLGVIGRLTPLVLPALVATSPFYVLIYAWSFGGIRDAQLESARLDGASWWQIWRSIAMPQAGPATLAVSVLAFTYHWGNFTDALLYLRGFETFTLPLGLQTLLLLNRTDWPLLMAGAVLYSLPPVAAFLVAQRFLLDDPLRALRRSTA